MDAKAVSDVLKNTSADLMKVMEWLSVGALSDRQAYHLMRIVGEARASLMETRNALLRAGANGSSEARQRASP